MIKSLDLKITGNPFIDSGIYAVSNLLKKDIEDITISDMEIISKDISKLYTEIEWKKNMHSIFPNSILVNPASTNKENLNELYLNNLLDLINTINPIQQNGSCMGCGRRNSQKIFGKDSIPLTGSKSLINYFSFGNPGADYCSLCALLIQFSPLTLYRCGGKFVVLHSDSRKVMNLWAKNAIEDLNNQKIFGKYTGCYNKGYTRPTNTIFNMISQVISSSSNWRGENPSFNFYFFSNYNQNPELEIFTFPTNVFNFLTNIPNEDKNNWNIIIKYSYRYIKNNDFVDEKKYKNNPNEVYERLIKGKSILKFFYSITKQKTHCSWKLVESYLSEVRNMDDKRIETIKNVGDRLSIFIKNEDKRKLIKDLEIASNYNTFRNILKKIFVSKIESNDEDLLFTFDEYVIYLFPEGNKTWRETQDLLLFRIYENLHDWLIENTAVEEISKDELLEES